MFLLFVCLFGFVFWFWVVFAFLVLFFGFGGGMFFVVILFVLFCCFSDFNYPMLASNHYAAEDDPDFSILLPPECWATTPDS